MMSRAIRTVLLVASTMPCAALAEGAGGALPDTATTTTQDQTVLDLPIEKIADTPGGCAVLDKDFPGMRAHPMYDYFKTMSLNQVAAMSKGQITPDMLAQARSDLTAVEPAVATVAAAPVDATPISIQP